MDSQKILTRSTAGLDNRVWRAMLVLQIISIGLLGYTILDREKCTPFTFDIGGRSHLNDSFYYTGENIPFNASIPSGNIKWDFNDNSLSSIEGAFVIHKFITEGKYYVSASKGNCAGFGRLITIKKKALPSFREVHADVKEIAGPSSTIVGKEEEFISPVLADSSYEWIVLRHRELGTSHSEKAKFQFAYSGTYVIQLTLDHDRIKYHTKQIVVEDLPKSKTKMADDVGPLIPKNLPDIRKKEEPKVTPTETTIVPPAPKAETKKSIRVADEAFRTFLQSLVESEMEESDFNRYLCGTGSTPVIVNHKNLKTFSQLCQEIRGKKSKKNFLSKKRSIQIQSVKLFHDEDNCVNKIEVNY